MDLLLLGLGNLRIVLPCSNVAILDHDLPASCRGTGEGRRRWNLHCHSGFLILGAHFRQLLSSESFLSHCQELLWIFLRCTRITGCRLSRLNSVCVQWPVLCHVQGFHPAGACPDQWRSLSAISISIYWQYHWAEFYYKTWSCLTWLEGWYRPAWLRVGHDSTSAGVGG